MGKTTATAEVETKVDGDEPEVYKVAGPSKFKDIDWSTITWPQFHHKYPKVPKSSYYTYRADAKPLAPDEIPVTAVEPLSLADKSLSDIQRAICNRIANGESESHACESEGISIDQHLIWMGENENSSPKYAEFVKKCIGFAEKRRKDELVDSIIHWKSRAWQASAWYLERKYPAEFAKPEGGGRGVSVNVGIQLNVSRRSKGLDISKKVKVSECQS